MKSLPKEPYLEAPKKCVQNMRDMKTWLRSEAFYDLMNFINSISNAIQGKRIKEEIYVSPTMEVLLDIFDKLNAIISSTPAVEQPQRFGNKAYRSFCGKMHHDIYSLLHRAIPENKCKLTIELGLYLSESFGNAVRIDYGTGHELSFLFFLCALFKGHILMHEDKVACALRLFNAYLKFVRRLQKTYNMDPAGSHGVWSLDDYQFVAYLWGSAQLSLDSPFPPQKFLHPGIIEQYKDDYMFIGCIDFITQMKSGHFAEHSVQLWSITAVPTWAKLYGGLLEMFQEEVLSSFAVMQSVHFGRLMAFQIARTGAKLIVPHLGIPPQIESTDSDSNASTSFTSQSIDADLSSIDDIKTARPASATAVSTAKSDTTKHEKSKDKMPEAESQRYATVDEKKTDDVVDANLEGKSQTGQELAVNFEDDGAN